MIIELREKKQRVTSPEDVAQIIQAVLATEDEIDRDKEHFWVLLLDARHRVKLLELVHLGTLDSATVHAREVFTRAVGYRCAGIIVAHNHPSGDPTPSREDEAITRRLTEAGGILGIPLLDHVIVAEEGYVSLKAQGVIGT